MPTVECTNCHGTGKEPYESCGCVEARVCCCRDFPCEVCDGRGTAPHEVCRYAEPVALPFAREWPVHAYHAPFPEQLAPEAARVIRQAQRSLTALPVCPLSGQPVRIDTLTRGIQVARVWAVLVCGHCEDTAFAAPVPVDPTTTISGTQEKPMEIRNVFGGAYVEPKPPPTPENGVLSHEHMQRIRDEMCRSLDTDLQRIAADMLREDIVKALGSPNPSAEPYKSVPGDAYRIPLANEWVEGTSNHAQSEPFVSTRIARRVNAEIEGANLNLLQEVDRMVADWLYD